METFNERFERLVKSAHLQKKDIAEKAGVSANGISTWKITGTIPRADIAIRIAQILNVSVEYLIIGELPTIDNKNSLAYKVAALSEDNQKIIAAVVSALESL